MPLALPRSDRKGAILSALLIAAVPLVLLAIAPNWIYSNPFVISWWDEWVYLSLFLHGPEYAAAHPSYYPATRLPWIFAGYPFYQLFPPLVANAAFKLIGFAATSLLLLRTLVAVTTGAVPLLATFLLSAYPYFVMSMGWNYVDHAVVILSAVAYYAAAKFSNKNDRAEFALGCVGAALTASNLFALALVPPIFLFGLSRIVGPARLSIFRVLRKSLSCLAGFCAGLLALGAVSLLLGGTFFFLIYQLQTSVSSAALVNTDFATRVGDLRVANWLALPSAAFVLAAFTGVAALRDARNAENRGAALRTALVMLHFVLLYAGFWLTTVTWFAVFTYWFYTSFLQVSSCITIACVWHHFHRKPLPAGTPFFLLGSAVILLLPFWAPVGRPLQQWLGLEPIGSVAAGGAVLAALALACAALRAGRPFLFPLAALALAYAHLGMLTQPQLNLSETRDRRAGFLAVVDASEAVRAFSGGPRRYVWADFKDQRYGALFEAAWIASILSERGGLFFGYDKEERHPALRPDGLAPGDRVIVISRQPDWRAAVNANLDLDRKGVRLLERASTRVEHGPVRFWITATDIVPRPPGSDAPEATP